jgi:ERCC4-type nuclease
MSDERFAEQAERMTRDLRAAKRLVEGKRSTAFQF